MKRLILLIVAACSMQAATTVTGTFCSGNRASVSWVRFDINGGQIAQSGPVSWTSGTYTEALEPGTDGSRYFFTVTCPSGGTPFSSYFLIPDTLSTLTVAQVAVGPTVKITDGWYWDTVSETWKNVAGGISGGGGGGGISNLNGLTGSSQSFATGTTGTNFGISSVGTTHTFNLPSASATNRGLLTSVDWTLFNSKLDPSGNAATATALAANPSNCPAGQYPKGVTANGSAEGCAVIPAADLPAEAVRTDQAKTYGAVKQDFGAATLEIPNGTTLPGTCAVGDQFMDTDATAGQNHYLCTATNTWTVQSGGGGGGGSFPVTTGITQSITVSGTTINHSNAGTPVGTNRITLGATDVTITNAPSISDVGRSDLQRINLCNVTTANQSILTLQDESQLPDSDILLGGGLETLKIYPGRCHEFQFSTAMEAWMHIGEVTFNQPGPPLGLVRASVQTDATGDNTVYTFQSIYPPSTAIVLDADNDQITHLRATVTVNPDGANRNLTSTPTITDGENGEELEVINIDTALTVTLNSEPTTANTNLRLCSASRTLAANGGSIRLKMSTDVGAWVEVGCGAADTGAIQTAYISPFPFAGSPSAGAIATAGQLRCYGFTIERATSFSRFSTNILTAQAGATVRIGVYDSNGNRLQSSAVIDASTTGLKTGTVTPFTLQPGFYYLCIGTTTTANCLGQVTINTTAHGVFSAGSLKASAASTNTLDGGGNLPATLGDISTVVGTVYLFAISSN